MKKNIVYNLREHVNHVNHVFAEKYLVYQLVKLHNGTTYDPLIFQKIEDNSHSLIRYSKYVRKTLLEKYSVECRGCYVCKQNNE